MRTIKIDMTESDCEEILRRVVFDEGEIEWQFPTDDGEDIKIKFVPYKGVEDDE